MIVHACVEGGAARGARERGEGVCRAPLSEEGNTAAAYDHMILLKYPESKILCTL